MAITSRVRAIAAKPASELAGRVEQALWTRVERVQFASGALARRNRLKRALVRELRNASAADLLTFHRTNRRPFFIDVRQKDAMRSVIVDRYSEELIATRVWAGRAAAHEVHFFGRVHSLPQDIPWHTDPVTGADWPRIFHGDVPTSGAANGYGDVKDVWELNRQQFLIDLAKSYFLDGNGPHAAEIRRLVTSWIAANPYGCGVNWASPLEPAYRALSWLWAYHLTLDDPAFDPEDHRLWLEGFFDHGRFLHDHLELFASPFNHLVGEAAALYLLGVHFPAFRQADAWRKRGREVLEQRLRFQFHDDGGSVEQATLYHHATLGFYLLAALTGRANGEEFPQDVWRVIERAIEFSMYLTQPDGMLPCIGDTDDARPIQLERKPYFDFRAYLAVGAALFARGDFKYIAGRFHEDALWLLGPDGRDRFDRLDARPPDERSVALRTSGYFVLRSDWSAGADYICFDCGEQAGDLRTDSVPSAAHGHADCLSVVVFLRGRPMLVDPGFFTYNGDERWERWLRETAAHTTARVDSRDQARHLQKMAWTNVPTPRLEQWGALEDQTFVAGSHDGFLADTGVIHRRYVWHRPGGYLVLFDDFEGTRPHDVDVNFQLAPGDACLGEHSVQLDEVGSVHWTASFPIDMSLACGGNGPDEGWIAPSLGVRLAAPALRLSGRVETVGAGVLTVLVPPGLAVARTPANAGALTLKITGEGWSDDWFAMPSGLPSDSFPTDAPLAVWRVQAGVVVEHRRIGGSRQNPEPGRVFEHHVTPASPRVAGATQ